MLKNITTMKCAFIMGEHLSASRKYNKSLTIVSVSDTIRYLQTKNITK